MRNKTTNLLLFLILIGASWFIYNRSLSKQPETLAPDTNETPPETLALDTNETPPETLALDTNETPPVVTNSAVPAEPIKFAFPVFTGSVPALAENTTSNTETLRNRLVTKELPRLMEDKEGSYTNLSNFFESDQTFSVDLNSDWATRHLFPNRNLPNLKIRVIKNPETGEYQPAGGTLTLPGNSLGVGYEIDPGTGESKSTLQWKKSF